MTDHPKPIARFRYALPHSLAMYRDGVAGDLYVFPKGMLFIVEADHEAALAAKDEEIAGHIAMFEASQRTLYETQVAKDARIAELEGDLDVAVANWKDFQRMHMGLRTAIEAKAREWKRKGNLKNWQTDPLKEGAAIAWDAAASDLLALLEKKP